MQAIVAVSQDWGIGFKNQLLFSLPTDMKHFRSSTLGGTVILGRNTLASLPNGNPLPKRNSILLSTTAEPQENLTVVRTIPESLTLVESLPSETVWVMGGEQVYRSLLPYCERVVVTKVYASVEADAFYPDLDTLGWRAEPRGEMQEENGLRFRFFDYYPPQQD